MATKKTFFEMTKELDEIIGALEKDELDLEVGLKEFEKGIKLFNECQKRLSEIELKTKVLIEKNGEFFLEEALKED